MDGCDWARNRRELRGAGGFVCCTKGIGNGLRTMMLRLALGPLFALRTPSSPVFATSSFLSPPPPLTRDGGPVAHAPRAAPRLSCASDGPRVLQALRSPGRPRVAGVRWSTKSWRSCSSAYPICRRRCLSSPASTPTSRTPPFCASSCSRGIRTLSMPLSTLVW